jgi:hypothetical protein
MVKKSTYLYPSIVEPEPLNNEYFSNKEKESSQLHNNPTNQLIFFISFVTNKLNIVYQTTCLSKHQYNPSIP